MVIKPIVTLPVLAANKTNAALALKRALVIASLGHTMSVAQCKGIYPA